MRQVLAVATNCAGTAVLTTSISYAPHLLKLKPFYTKCATKPCMLSDTVVMREKYVPIKLFQRPKT